MLELKDICLEIDNKNILKDINLTIDRNKLFIITGPNGSGKSSLAKIIMGITKPTSGSIILDGEDITNLNVTERAKLGITFTFQTPVKFKGIRVIDLLNISSKNLINFEIGKKYLSSVGLCANEYLYRNVDNSLSGGELKRIEIATALSKISKISIFDEPEAGIDLWSFEELINVFKQIKKEKNMSTIIISHQEKIFNLADKIILLKNGSISKIGTFKQIKPLLKKKNCVMCKGEII